jgi:hypothetical protein
MVLWLGTPGVDIVACRATKQRVVKDDADSAMKMRYKLSTVRAMAARYKVPIALSSGLSRDVSRTKENITQRQRKEQ